MWAVQRRDCTAHWNVSFITSARNGLRSFFQPFSRKEVSWKDRVHYSFSGPRRLCLPRPLETVYKILQIFEFNSFGDKTDTAPKLAIDFFRFVQQMGVCPCHDSVCPFINGQDVQWLDFVYGGFRYGRIIQYIFGNKRTPVLFFFWSHRTSR
jgi:hypothetical protein